GAINEPHLFIAIRVDANSEPNTACFKGSNFALSFFIDCEGVEAAGDGFNTGTAIGCYAGSNGGDGFDLCYASHCYAESNTGLGFRDGNSLVVNSIARANGTGGFG